ncbi:MAG: (Fe-S)-binding protein [Candidatus Hermodarchaeota archaeon]
MSDYAEQIHRCFRCGYCKFPSNFIDYNCPSYKRFKFESYSTGGRLWLLWAWLKNEIEWSEHLAEIIFSCVTCRNCVESCPMKFKEDIIDWIISVRSEMIEQGKVLPKVSEFLNNIHCDGNPWGFPRNTRDVWMNYKKYYSTNNEYLFYVGCVGSYEQRGQQMAKAFMKLLDRTNQSYGLLGIDEECDGNEVYMLGEKGLFKELVQKNIDTFENLGVKKVVTLSPHSYNIMKNKYYGLKNIEIFHYTQLLNEIIQNHNVSLSQINTKVTYHDPCYLGRYNGVYDIPREILESIPGVELIEMPRNRDNSFCCGGGSGNFVYDLLGRSEESPNIIRVKEAYETGAESLIVTCPSCKMMLDDAVKKEQLENEIMVKDLSEFIVSRLR